MINPEDVPTPGVTEEDPPKSGRPDYPEETLHRPQTPAPTIAPAPRRSADGTVPEQSPEMEAAMGRVLRGEAPSSEPLDDWPVPTPDEVEPPDPYANDDELAGDALAIDQRSDYGGQSGRPDKPRSFSLRSRRGQD